MQILGLDIGGANLKAATASGQACSVPFDLWRAPDELPQQLRELLQRFPPADALAVTMTGELADCFATKAEGVRRIVQSCEEVAGNRPVHFWHTSGQFVSAARAIAEPLGIAAANWHALATWAGRLVPHGRALLIDIGSTTTDLIPLVDGHPCPQGLTDVTRLLAGELVYTGVRRTPLCAVAPSAPFRGQMCPLAAELFATTLDVYLILGLIPEDAEDCHTANGRPATKAAAHDRLARMLCCDREELSLADATVISRFFADAQQRQLRDAVSKVLQRSLGELQAVVVSGSGSCVAKRLVTEMAKSKRFQIVSLNSHLGDKLSEAACAYAIATILS